MTPVDDRRALAPYYEEAEEDVEPWDEELDLETDEEEQRRVDRYDRRCELLRDAEEAGHARGR